MADDRSTARAQLLSSLNAKQAAAAFEGGGPLEVLAGPGSGKTRTLIARVGYLIETEGVLPRGIYLITFTRRASAEMRGLLHTVVEAELAEQVNVSTIDALAYRIAVAAEKYKGKTFANMPAVADEALAYQAFRDVMQEQQVPPALLDTRAAWQIMRQWKLGERNPVYLPEGLPDVVAAYQARLAEMQKWDIADLMPMARAALTENPEIAAAFNVQHMLVDEWQDSTPAQFAFIRTLMKDCRNFFCVGAPGQSIYGWRRADYDSLHKAWISVYPEYKRIILDTNYRSGEPIVETAASVVPDHPEARLISTRSTGQVYVHDLPTEAHEARLIAGLLKQIVADHHKLAWKDCAVLVRSWAQRGALEEAFLEAELPYTLANEKLAPFYKTESVLALLGYLRCIQAVRGRDTGADIPALRGALDLIINTPRRGIGPASLALMLAGQAQLGWDQFLGAMVSERFRPQVREALQALFTLLTQLAGDDTLQTPAELIRAVLAATGWIDSLTTELDGHTTLRNLRDLETLAGEFDTVAQFLEAIRARLGGDWNRDGVTLSSIHTAKGLQWKAVFVPGLNEGVLPHVSALKASNECAEEARLAHVAFSRPEDLLFITYTHRRKDREGQLRRAVPSRFLNQLPQKWIQAYDPDRPIQIPHLAFPDRPGDRSGTRPESARHYDR